MAKLDKVVLRYAKAAFDYLGDLEKANTVATEMKVFYKTFQENTDLQAALTNEAFSTQNRVAVAKEVSERLGLGAETVRVLAVLSENRRIPSAKWIAERLHQLCLEAADIALLEVESSKELSSEERNKIELQFSKILGKKVEAKYSLEPTLLGGLRVTAAGRTYDGTLSGWLEKMEEKLMGGHL
jgi:F-type H+-transporting ATPase subunit delta